MPERIYLDYAASTPVDPRVFKIMQPYFAKESGNPGSLHSFGQAAMKAVDEAREKIAAALEADFREIIFTGSATEANNLALRGTFAGARKIFPGRKPRIIVSAVEHESVLETARALQEEGAELVYLPVDAQGKVSLSALKKALTPETVLVSVMYVNNETGTVQPVQEIAAELKNFRTAAHSQNSAEGIYPLLHTDAAQAFQFFTCQPRELGADLMTLSAHKIYGPKGAGALYIREGAKRVLRPVITGGGQEFGFRSGTENVPVLAGFGEAALLAAKEREKNTRDITRLKKAFWEKLRAGFPGARQNSPKDSAPHILNVYLPGCSAEDLLTKLDLGGLSVSAGSACRSRAMTDSYVLKAMGFPEKRVRESLRISFGKTSSTGQVSAAARLLIQSLRR